MLKRLIQHLWADRDSFEFRHRMAPQDGDAAPSTESHATLPRHDPIRHGQALVEDFAGLSLSRLQAQRQLLENQQRRTVELLKDLESDRKGIVARYAAARVAGQGTEMQALERTYDNLEHRIRAAGLRHADQLLDLSLIDEACALREDLEAREVLRTDALAGLDIERMGELMGQQCADQMSSRTKRQELLDNVRDHHADSHLYTLAGQRPIHDELIRLTEDEFQRVQKAHVAALDAAAQRIDQQLAQPLAQRDSGLEQSVLLDSKGGA